MTSLEWVIKASKQPENENIQTLVDGLSIHETVAEMVATMGFTSLQRAESLLKPNFYKEMHCPYKMKGMFGAVETLSRTIDAGGKILFYGDYDCDGVTTTALFVRAMRELDVEVDWYVPNRFTDGYGIPYKNVEWMVSYDLVVTGDTGIKEFESLKSLGSQTKVIVTDHHEPVVNVAAGEAYDLITTEEETMALPIVDEVLNPKRIDCSYPSKDLSGAAVMFKYMQALYKHREKSVRGLYQHMDLVACGLVADLVPVFDKHSMEVRNMIKLGLAQMNQAPDNWVRSILALTKKTGLIDEEALGYTYGPLLNAVGRMGSPEPAVRFLIEDNAYECHRLCETLVEKNKERQDVSRESSERIQEGLGELAEERKDYGVVVDDDDLHIGITGLVAGNILNTYYRPTIALAKFHTEDGEVIYKGSARSIAGVDVLKALIEVEKKMGTFRYGGHEQAAGLSLRPDQVVEFRACFREAVRMQVSGKEEKVFRPKKYYDKEIKIRDVSEELVEGLELLKPFGMGHEKPLFRINRVLVTGASPSKSKKAVRLSFTQEASACKAIMFHGVEEAAQHVEKLQRQNKGPLCDVLGYPVINTWRGKRTLQLMVKELHWY